MPLKVLFVSAEVHPYRKVGGLADVAGALPKYLAQRGIDVRVVTPLYRGVPRDGLRRLDSVLVVPMYSGPGYAGARVGQLPGSDVPVYFLEHDHYYDRDSLYGHDDDLERYVFLSRGALELTRALGWVPDVVHANDWHTAFVPVYLNTVEYGQPLHAAASVFTVHNLSHQGDHDAGAHFITGLGGEHFNAGEFEHFGRFNPMKAALWHSTLLTTVSPRYALEIQTGPFGAGLDGVLAARAGDLRGILNGIDETDWDPGTDPHLPAHFDRGDLSGKAACKAALQQEMGLPQRSDVPLFGVVSRLTRQKGHDVLAAALDRLLDLDLQVVVLGTGDQDIEHALWSAAARRPDRFACRVSFDPRLEHGIQAGADFLFVPSRFEPCGLTQLYAQRYGTLPILRATGGLADTVIDYEEHSGAGTGFVLGELTPDALVGTAARARSMFHNRRHHLDAMRDRAMGRDWTWGPSAAEYERVYLDAYARRRGHAFAASAPYGDDAVRDGAAAPDASTG